MTAPTHRHVPTGALVFPDGYDPADLEELAPGEWDARELARVRAEARVVVDRSAGAFRSGLLTDIAFQGGIYDVKAAQAQAFLAAFAAGTATADATAFAYVYQEALACLGEATVANMKARADIIMAAAGPAAALLPVQEALRVARKEAILAAETPEEVVALAEVDWSALLG
jgi:hypothetical protein